MAPNTSAADQGIHMYQPPQPKPKKRRSRVQLGCFGVIAIAIIGTIAVATSNGTKSTTASTNATAPALPSAPPTDSAAAPAANAQQADSGRVVFSCTGSAPDGVDITYGPEGSDYSASSLPFTKSLPVQATAQYYNVTAQLSGAGQVSCTTVVNDQGSSTTQTGTATGGYNIASAEVCSTFDGSWNAC